MKPALRLALVTSFLLVAGTSSAAPEAKSPAATKVPETLPTTFKGVALKPGTGVRPSAGVATRALPDAVAVRAKAVLAPARAVTLGPISDADANAAIVEIQALVGVPATFETVEPVNNYRGDWSTNVALVRAPDKVYLKLQQFACFSDPNYPDQAASCSDWSVYVPLGDADVTYEPETGIVRSTCKRDVACITTTNSGTEKGMSVRISPYRAVVPAADAVKAAVDGKLRFLAVYGAQKKR